MSSNILPINIAIVDDEALIVILLSEFFSKHERINVVLTANDGTVLIDKLTDATVLPDIVLLDLQMKNMNGIEASEIVKKEFPEIKIIVMSSHYKKSFMGFMMKLGVSAFLPKGIEPLQLAEAMESVFDKGYYFMEEQIDVMRKQISANVPEPAFRTEDTLSEREIEVLQLICQQFTAQQIADKLFITKRTVEGHKSNLLLKTSARNTAGLVLYAIQKHIINIDNCFFSK